MPNGRTPGLSALSGAHPFGGLSLQDQALARRYPAKPEPYRCPHADLIEVTSPGGTWVVYCTACGASY